MVSGWRTGQRQGNGLLIRVLSFLPTLIALPLVVLCIVETSMLLSMVVISISQNKAAGTLI
eukprot:5902296-Karenia_brevis.AAC.1